MRRMGLEYYNSANELLLVLKIIIKCILSGMMNVSVMVSQRLVRRPGD